ncbi:MAG: hypothetical protein MUF42_09825, partial [Cytophagaceae bacterium]|nr:hypothetical protein [Cytophagaceae bacterium]
MNYFVFLRILLLLATLKELLAIPVVILNNQSSEIKLLGPQVEVWRDTLSYTLNQVRRLQSEIDFKCPQDKPNNSASLHSAYWIRFKVVNNSECPLWLLEFPDLHIGHIQVYEGDSMIGTGGYLENFENRGLLHKNPSYYIKPGREKEYYIRLQSDLGASFHMKIKSPLYYSSYAHQEYYYLGLYYGVILIMAIYNFFLFLKIREWAYLFYVFYVLSCALHTFREDGIGFQFFWPNNPWMNYYFKEISFLLLMLSFVTYSILFLNLYERQRQFFWFTIGSVLAYLCLFTWITVSDTIREAHTIYFLVPILLVYFAAILQYRRGQRFVRYFLLAY